MYLGFVYISKYMLHNSENYNLKKKILSIQNKKDFLYY